MRAGSLREIIEVQELTVTSTTHGDVIETWTKIATRFAALREDRSRQVTVTMRYYAGLTVTSGEFLDSDGEVIKNHRFIHKGRILNIEDVLNLESRERMHRVHCVIDDERF